MGIYLPNMKMPKSCWICFARRDVDIGVGIADGCDLLKAMICNPDERLDDCPLVPVPPHGRLIDADAVTDAAMEDILGWEDAGCDRSDYRAFLDNYIEDAPTIIPAEEGER